MIYAAAAGFVVGCLTTIYTWSLVLSIKDELVDQVDQHPD